MLINIDTLRNRIEAVLLNKKEQGHEIDNLYEKFESLPKSYDKLINFTITLNDLPISSKWKYSEPNDLENIWSEADRKRPVGVESNIDIYKYAKKIESAFLGSICGCILGKPLEAMLTGQEIKSALKEINEWPLNNYISKNISNYLPRTHVSFSETAREFINYVAPDDDINYTILGMINLENHGAQFDHSDIKKLWLKHLPIGITFGPERTNLLISGLQSIDGIPKTQFLEKGGVGANPKIYNKTDVFSQTINNILNPGDELCGASIRADAYGYACPGNPSLAAELAWKDASFTHKRTGIYGTMFIAAAISCAQVLKDKIQIFKTALQFVPQNSRFFERVSGCLNIVKEASNWEEAYNKINSNLGEFGHCRIYQEMGMLINTLKFSTNVGDGLCIQVSQGADTDSFGATAGSILGAYYGPGYLEKKWLEPFNDDLRTGMAHFFERSLTKIAERMGRLPQTLVK